MALFLFAYHCLRPTRAGLAALGVASGIAVFWNFDSGIPVLISIGATLLVKPFFTLPLRWKILLPALVFSTVAALTFGTLIIALRIKAGGPLGIQEAIASQKLFYGSGFMMLPMPQALHPWQIILIVYAAAAVAALSAWRRHIDHQVFDVLFCAAFFVSLGSVTLAFSARELVTAGINNLADFQKPRDPIVASELAFLRSTYKGRNCLILAQRQAIYHAELKNASPLPGPGMIETLLQSDLDALMAGALNKPVKCIYLGVGPSSQTLVQLDDAKLISKYPVSAKNDMGTLLLLEPPHQ